MPDRSRGPALIERASLIPLHAVADADTAARIAAVVGRSWGFAPERIPEIRALAARIAAAPRAVVFVAPHRSNFPTIEYVAHALRERGYAVFGVYLFSPAPADTFTESFSCQGSFWALSELVLRLAPVPIYLQAHAKQSFLSQLIHALRPELRLVQEVYDWMESFIDPAAESAFVEAGVFTADEIALMRASERYLRRSTAGFIYKDGGEPMRARLAQATVPSAQLLPCPPAAWMRPPVPRQRQGWHLVHAGQLRSRTTAPRIFGDLQCVPLFRRLLDRGLFITAYPSYCKTPELFQDFFGDYQTLAAEAPRFSLRSWMPQARLLAELHGRFDFGLLLYPFPSDLAVGKDHLRGALASKLFAYLAAGLPVLVSEELAYMATIVREHGIGLVLGQSDLSDLDRRLEAQDYPALQERVRVAQRQLHIERYLPGVLDLIQGPSRTTHSTEIARDLAPVTW